MLLHLLQRQGEQGGECVGGGHAPGQVVRLEVADRTISRVGPTYEQQRRTIPALGIRGIVHVCPHRVGLAVAPGARGGALVHSLVPAQGTVRQLRRRDSRSTRSEERRVGREWTQRRAPYIAKEQG